ncbi:MAG TPA: GxxExxY protein [Pyrinomonadaceae bacterium]|nr:GxxExxY protein [Pyrinomonadaceae bacterium]
MNTASTRFKYGDITSRIIGIFFDVYNELGYGFLESVYEKSLEYALNSAGINVCSQIEIPVWFRGNQVGDFSADMLVEKCVLLELKSARAIDKSHEAQLLNYLRATHIEVGLLLNFGLKPEFKRMIFDNPRKSIRANPCSSVAALLDPEN